MLSANAFTFRARVWLELHLRHAAPSGAHNACVDLIGVRCVHCIKLVILATPRLRQVCDFDRAGLLRSIPGDDRLRV